MTAGSSQSAYVSGTGTAVPASAVMTRYSRAMSWAVASTWPSGGRRTIQELRPSVTS